jgi:hypothetical protein
VEGEVKGEVEGDVAHHSQHHHRVMMRANHTQTPTQTLNTKTPHTPHPTHRTPQPTPHTPHPTPGALCGPYGFGILSTWAHDQLIYIEMSAMAFITTCAGAELIIHELRPVLASILAQVLNPKPQTPNPKP